jgi:hypothetical protein
MLSFRRFLPWLIDAAADFDAINWIEPGFHTFRLFLTLKAKPSNRASNDLQKA